MAPVSLEDMFRENKTPVQGFVATGFEKVVALCQKEYLRILVNSFRVFFVTGFKTIVKLLR